MIIRVLIVQCYKIIVIFAGVEKLRENYRSRRGAKQVAGGNNESGDEDTEDYDLYYIGIYITSSIQESKL